MFAFAFWTAACIIAALWCAAVLACAVYIAGWLVLSAL
jgi:hypothetical protein